MSEIAFRIDRSIEPNLFASELSSRLADRNLIRTLPSVSVLSIDYLQRHEARTRKNFLWPWTMLYSRRGSVRRPILSGTVEVFDFDIDTHGARVVVRLHPLCSGCLTDREVDANIKLLKEDLEAVAGRMKAALQMQDHKSLTE